MFGAQFVTSFIITLISPKKHTRPIFVLILGLLSIFSSSAQQSFISTWQTDNPGTSDNTSITIPTVNSLAYSYDVDWDNDGNFDELGITGDVTHDFGAAGSYTIRVRGDFPAIRFENEGDKEKLIDIQQWGTISWQSFAHAFQGCANLTVSAVDAPDLSLVSNLTGTFTNCSNFNSNINHWNTSTINNLDGTFNGCSTFNQPLDNWDVSNVETMRFTFSNATAFNQDIGNWDVRKVKNMGTLFSGAEAFNQDISGWQFDSLQTVDFMFRRAAAFNQPIGVWEMPLLTSLRGMFAQAESFNQDVSDWDVSNITNFSYLFDRAGSFDQDITTWDVSNGTTFSRMFNGARAFNQAIGVWDLGNAEETDYMFRGAFEFNQPIGAWDVSNVTTMAYMFSQTSSFQQDIGNWDVSSVQFFQNMFSHADSFNVDIGGWNTGAAQNMSFMFNRNDVFNQDIGRWDVSNVTTTQAMFTQALAFNQNLNDWDVSSVTNMQDMFSSTPVFNSPLDQWDVSSVTNMQSMFFASTNFNQDIGDWDVSKVTDFFRLFRQAANFNQNLNNWNVSNATSMQEMFHGTNSFNQPLDQWDVANVTNMISMFFGATTFDQDLGDWNVSSLLSAGDMLVNVPLSVANYDSLLIGWGSQDVHDTVTFSATISRYCLGGTARDRLTTTFGWFIDDAGAETEAPIAVCNDTVVFVPWINGQVYLDPEIVGEASTDNCSLSSLTLSATQFTCDDAGMVIQDTLTATDVVGNSDQCIFNVSVIDTNSNLLVFCPGDTLVSATDTGCAVQVHWTEPVFRCNVLTILSNYNSGENFSTGTHNVQYNATDVDNNVDVCEFTITVIDDLNVSIDSVEAPTCSDLEDGVAHLIVEGGVSPYQFDWDKDGQGDFDDSAGGMLAAGTHIVQVRDSIGCVATDTIVVSTNSSAFSFCPADTLLSSGSPSCRDIINWEQPQALCSEAVLTSNYNLGDSLDFGTTTIAYTSTDLLGNQSFCTFDVTLVGDSNFVIACPRDTVLEANNAGCGSVVELDSPQVRCDVQTITSTIPSDNYFAKGLHEVEYTVVNTTGIVQTCTQEVNIRSDLSMVLDSVQLPTCSDAVDGEAFYSITGGISPYSFDWNLDGQGDWNDSMNLTLPAGSWILQVADSLGCTEMDTITLVANSSQIVACPSDTIVTSFEDDCNVVVFWEEPLKLCSEALMTSNYVPGTEFEYGVHSVLYTARDLLGNESTCSFTITIRGDSSQLIRCPEDTTIVANNDACSATGVWKNPYMSCDVQSFQSSHDPGSDFSLGATVVSYTAFGMGDEQQSCSFAVNVVSDLALIIDSVDAPTCSDLVDGRAYTTVTGGALPYRYDWAHDGFGDNDDDATTLLPTGEIAVRVYDANDCLVADTAYLEANSSGIINCPSNLTVAANGANCSAIASWDEPEALCTEASLTSTHEPGDTFSFGRTQVNYVVRDLLGNESTCNFLVIVTNDLTIEVDSVSMPSCAAISDGSASITVEGGQAPYLYDWAIDGQGDLDDSSTVFLSAGIHEVQVIDANGCEASENIVIIANSAGIKNCPGDTSIRANVSLCRGIVHWTEPEVCFGTQLSASSSPGDTFDLGVTEVIYESLDIYGNTSGCSFVVTVYNDLEIQDSRVESPFCEDDSSGIIAINVQGGVAPFELQTNQLDSVFAGLLIEVAVAGMHYVTLKDASDCEVSIEVVVPQKEMPVIGIDSVFDGVDWSLFTSVAGGSEPYDFLWNTGSDEDAIIAYPDTAMWYVIEVADAKNCMNRDSIYLNTAEEELLEFDFMIPNVFTPNDDGKNDTWYIEGIGEYEHYEIEIYNRWGSRVYHKIDEPFQWTGKYEGKELKSAVYFYALDVKHKNREKQFKGTISLVR